MLCLCLEGKISIIGDIHSKPGDELLNYMIIASALLQKMFITMGPIFISRHPAALQQLGPPDADIEARLVMNYVIIPLLLKGSVMVGHHFHRFLCSQV